MSLESLLAQIVDYAGLFPPAQLDMAPTVRNYAGYVAGDDAWMLGRLIVPAARLDELEAAAADLLPRDGSEPWHLSALTAPAGDDGLAAHLERIAAFNERWGGGDSPAARVDVIELRAAGAAAVDAALELIPDELFPFFELSADADVRGPLAAMVGSDAGAKVRTGGVTADLYPTADALARFVAACAAARVPFKATAGLHHPVRHHSAAVNAKEHGFLNVFMAAALAAELEIDHDTVVAILEDEAPGSFVFADESASWRDLSIGTERLRDVRERRAISFGSCSFDEPREDLRALGLL